MKEHMVRTLRILGLVLLVWSVLSLVLLTSLSRQKDTLPRFMGLTVKLMEDDRMAPAAGRGTLLLLREKNPFEPGDIVSYLDNRNGVSIGRIYTIDDRKEGISVTVPFRDLREAGENLSGGMDLESVMEEDPTIQIRTDADRRKTRTMADRLTGKVVFRSRWIGRAILLYRNPAAAILLTALSLLLAVWPFRDRGDRRPNYSERDIEGPWIG